MNDEDFNHFSSSFNPNAGPGVSVSTPDCFQTRSTSSSPIHDTLRVLPYSESDSALDLMSLPPFSPRYVLYSLIWYVSVFPGINDYSDTVAV